MHRGTVAVLLCSAPMSPLDSLNSKTLIVATLRELASHSVRTGVGRTHLLLCRWSHTALLCVPALVGSPYMLPACSDTVTSASCDTRMSVMRALTCLGMMELVCTTKGGVGATLANACRAVPSARGSSSDPLVGSSVRVALTRAFHKSCVASNPAC